MDDTSAQRLRMIWSRVTAGDVVLDPRTARRLLAFCEEARFERARHLSERDMEQLRDAVLASESGF